MWNSSCPQAAADCPAKAFTAGPAETNSANYSAFPMPRGQNTWETVCFPGLDPWPLPRIEIVDAVMDEAMLPELPPACIEGLLRKGGKMLIYGPSKAHKTFSAIQLGVSVATGSEWLGFRCEKSRILYVNLEVAHSQFMKRVHDVATAMGADAEDIRNNFKVAHIERCSPTITQFVSAIVARSDVENCEMVIIDPLYKAFEGSENDQNAMAAFFKQVDRLIDAWGCSVVTVHHQAKGPQSFKEVIDRASGSGVLARDPDALVSINRLNAPGVAMRAEFVTRDYAEPRAVNYRIIHPLCTPDTTGALDECPYTTTTYPGSRRSKEAQLERVERACEKALAGGDIVKRKAVLEKLGNMKPETFDKYVDKSERFSKCKIKNVCYVQRDAQDASSPSI